MAGENLDRAFCDLATGRPWKAEVDPAVLQIDLGLRFPVHSVRRPPAQEGPATEQPAFRLSFSDDGAVWTDPEVLPYGGAARTADAVILVPGEGCWARHIRVTPTGGDRTSPDRFEVLCDPAMLDLIILRRQLDAGFDIIDERPGNNPFTAYSLVRSPRAASKALVGVAVYQNGAFGNCLIQYILAIGVARNLGVRYVKLPSFDRSDMIDLHAPLTCRDITFIPGSFDLPEDGYFLSGMYFDIPIQKLAGTLGEAETRDIVRTYITPLFNKLPTHIPHKPDDELLIHIRSGDIFSTWVAPHYPQPPLAFYQMVVQRLLAEKRIATIKLIFENRLNPVIAELEAYLTRIGIPFSTQSGTLADDVAALLNGRYLVFGLGTFGPGICHLSEGIEQVFYFASGSPQHFKSISTIGKVVEVIDTAGAYTKVGEWDNSPERRRMMIDYPIEDLAFDDAAG